MGTYERNDLVEVRLGLPGVETWKRGRIVGEIPGSGWYWIQPGEREVPEEIPEGFDPKNGHDGCWVATEMAIRLVEKWKCYKFNELVRYRRPRHPGLIYVGRMVKYSRYGRLLKISQTTADLQAETVHQDDFPFEWMQRSLVLGKYEPFSDKVPFQFFWPDKAPPKEEQPKPEAPKIPPKPAFYCFIISVTARKRDVRVGATAENTWLCYHVDAKAAYENGWSAAEWNFPREYWEQTVVVKEIPNDQLKFVCDVVGVK